MESDEGLRRQKDHRNNNDSPKESSYYKQALNVDITKSIGKAQEKTMLLLAEQAKNLHAMHSMIQLLTTNMKTMSERIGVVEKTSLASYNKQRRGEESLIDDPDISAPRAISQDRCRAPRCDSSGRRINLHKWNVKFYGTSRGMSVESFIFRIETLQKKNVVTDAQIFANFHHFVTGAAEKWYWQYLQENEGGEFLNLYELKTELLRRFRDKKADHEFLRTVMDRRQQPNESFDDFYEEVRGLTLQMKTRPREKEIVEIVRQNL